jgi:hypothetical protein
MTITIVSTKGQEGDATMLPFTSLLYEITPKQVQGLHPHQLVIFHTSITMLEAAGMVIAELYHL